MNAFKIQTSKFELQREFNENADRQVPISKLIGKTIVNLIFRKWLILDFHNIHVALNDYRLYLAIFNTLNSL